MSLLREIRRLCELAEAREDDLQAELGRLGRIISDDILAGRPADPEIQSRHSALAKELLAELEQKFGRGQTLLFPPEIFKQTV